MCKHLIRYTGPSLNRLQLCLRVIPQYCYWEITLKIEIVQNVAKRVYGRKYNQNLKNSKKNI